MSNHTIKAGLFGNTNRYAVLTNRTTLNQSAEKQSAEKIATLNREEQQKDAHRFLSRSEQVLNRSLGRNQSVLFATSRFSNKLAAKKITPAQLRQELHLL